MFLLKKTLALVIAAGPLAFSACQQETANYQLGIFYQPLGTATLSPITADNISQKGWTCVLLEKKAISKILAILDTSFDVETAPLAQIADNTVRVKIVKLDSGKETVIAVVSEGGWIKRPDRKMMKLSPEKIKELKQLIEPCIHDLPPGIH